MEQIEYTLINRFGNRNYYRVPENYFDSFAAQWQTDGAVVAVKKPLIVSLRSSVRTWLYMAAMFIGIFFMLQTVYTVHQNHRQQAAENYELYLYSQVQEADVIDYYYASEEF